MLLSICGGLLIIYSLVQIAFLKNIRIPENPCDEIFSYERSNGEYFGLVKLPYDGAESINLSVNVSMLGFFPNEVIRAKILTSSEDIEVGKDILFRINFPKQVVPKITTIELNNKVHCSGPPEQMGSEGVTSAWATISRKLPNKLSLPLRLSALSHPEPYRHWPQHYHNPFQQFKQFRRQFENNKLYTDSQNDQPNDHPHSQHYESYDDRSKEDKAEFFLPRRYVRQPNMRDSAENQLDNNPFLKKKIEIPSFNQFSKPSLMNNPFLKTHTQFPNLDKFTSTWSPIESEPWSPSNPLPWLLPKLPSWFPSHTLREPTQSPTLREPEHLQPQPSQSNPEPVQPAQPPADLPPKPFVQHHCGEIQLNGNRIFGGDMVHSGDLPWLTAIFVGQNFDYRYQCVGSLITDRHVISAAHCFHHEDNNQYQSPDQFLFVLGTNDVSMLGGQEGAVSLQGKELMIHPDYRPKFADADVGIALLLNSVEFSKLIQPICLWKEPNALQSIVEHIGLVAGWGIDEDLKVDLISAKQTSLKVTPQPVCTDSYPVEASSRTFCAGERNGRGPCRGDSGSGFIMFHKNRFFLHGIVSMSKSDIITICDMDDYTIFTDVSQHMDWIGKMVQ